MEIKLVLPNDNELLKRQRLLSVLSVKEREVTILLAKGLQNKEIAELLGTSLDNVKKHTKNIYKKLEVRNRTEAANFASMAL